MSDCFCTLLGRDGVNVKQRKSQLNVDVTTDLFCNCFVIYSLILLESYLYFQVQVFCLFCSGIGLSQIVILFVANYENR